MSYLRCALFISHEDQFQKILESAYISYIECDDLDSADSTSRRSALVASEERDERPAMVVFSGTASLSAFVWHRRLGRVFDRCRLGVA